MIHDINNKKSLPPLAPLPPVKLRPKDAFLCWLTFIVSWIVLLPIAAFIMLINSLSWLFSKKKAPSPEEYETPDSEDEELDSSPFQIPSHMEEKTGCYSATMYRPAFERFIQSIESIYGSGQDADKIPRMGSLR